MTARKAQFMLLLTLTFVIFLRFAKSAVPPEEVETMANILADMNATSWRFNGESCSLEMISKVPQLSTEANATVICNCNIGNDTDCHVIRITHKFYSLDGVLSPDMAKLPYLRSFDAAYNYLQGTIPPEWGSSRLEEISILGNRITGEIPPELGNLTSITRLDFEANYLSGTIPPELGRLYNLRSLMLSSNQFTGRLPTALGQLGNLTIFRISENNFSGPIPEFIQNWRQLARLRIGEMTGPSQPFPPLNILGRSLRYVFLTDNELSGDIPNNLLIIGAAIDLSYNNFTWQGPNQHYYKTVYTTRLNRSYNPVFNRDLYWAI